MKKVLAIAVIMMMVPFSAFALEMISDSQMDEVTGQHGVSIAADDVVLYQYIDYVRYEDKDGTWAFITTSENMDAAMIGLSSLVQIQKFNAITSIAFTDTDSSMMSNTTLFGINGNETYTVTSPYEYGSQGHYTVGSKITRPICLFNYAATAGTAPLGSSTFMGANHPRAVIQNALGTTSTGYLSNFEAKALWIDAGVMGVLTKGIQNNSMANAGVGLGPYWDMADTWYPFPSTVIGVRIGLPTIEITTEGLDFDITVEPTTNVSGYPAGNYGQYGPMNATYSMGSLSIGKNTTLPLDGWIEIAAHSFTP